MGRICKTCLKELDESNFNKRKAVKDGLHIHCRKCVSNIKAMYANINKKHLWSVWKNRKEKRDFINDIKLKSGCAYCGYKKSSEALTFHHIDPKTKIDGVSNLVAIGASREKIIAEIKKCIILCQNCHHEFHEAEKKAKKIKYEPNANYTNKPSDCRPRSDRCFRGYSK